MGGGGEEGGRGSFGVEATGPPVVNRTSTDAMVSGGALRLWGPFFHKKISVQRNEIFLNKEGKSAQKIITKMNYFRKLSFKTSNPRLNSF